MQQQTDRGRATATVIAFPQKLKQFCARSRALLPAAGRQQKHATLNATVKTTEGMPNIAI